MANLSTIVFYLGVVAYSAAATLFFVSLARVGRAEQTVRWAPWALGVGGAAHLLHIILLATAATSAGPVPIAFSSCAWITVAAYLFLRGRNRIDAIGVIVSPLALTFLVGAEFVGARGLAPSFPRTLLALHIFANFLGVGLFLLAGAAGAFYLVVERRLKEKRAALTHGRLPPLDALDSTEHRLLLAGFPLLTFGIVTGAVFMAQMDGLSGVDLMRAVLAYATWVLVAGVILLRALLGWRGRRAAYGTLAGVVCVLLVIVIYVVQSPVAGSVP